jgi:molybdopterin converting factor small subunit
MTIQTQIEVEVLAFGQIADCIGCSSFLYQSPPTLLAFKNQLEKDYPALAKLTYRIAVNKKLIGIDCELIPNSELALLPPFSGG